MEKNIHSSKSFERDQEEVQNKLMAGKTKSNNSKQWREKLSPMGVQGKRDHKKLITEVDPTI
jgi:hypothetical protein